LFNEQHHDQAKRMHGCVTTGEVWQFLKLQDKEVLVDEERYHINEVGKIVGVLLAVVRGNA
jgi:hypothetical protein